LEAGAFGFEGSAPGFQGGREPGPALPPCPLPLGPCPGHPCSSASVT